MVAACRSSRPSASRSACAGACAHLRRSLPAAPAGHMDARYRAAQSLALARAAALAAWQLGCATPASSSTAQSVWPGRTAIWPCSLRAQSSSSSAPPVARIWEGRAGAAGVSSWPPELEAGGGLVVAAGGCSGAQGRQPPTAPPSVEPSEQEQARGGSGQSTRTAGGAHRIQHKRRAPAQRPPPRPQSDLTSKLSRLARRPHAARARRAAQSAAAARAACGRCAAGSAPTCPGTFGAQARRGEAERSGGADVGCGAQSARRARAVRRVLARGGGAARTCGRWRRPSTARRRRLGRSGRRRVAGRSARAAP